MVDDAVVVVERIDARNVEIDVCEINLSILLFTGVAVVQTRAEDI